MLKNTVIRHPSGMIHATTLMGGENRRGRLKKVGYAFPRTSASATAKVGAAVGRRERGLVGIAAAKAIRAVADGGTAELAVPHPGRSHRRLFESSVATTL